MSDSWIDGGLDELDDLESSPECAEEPFPVALRPAVALALLNCQAAMAGDSVSDAERRILSEFTRAAAAGLGLTAVMEQSRRQAAALRRLADSKDCTLASLAASVLTDPADRAIVVYCLSYLMRIQNNPLESAVDSVQRALGLPPQLHDCSRSFHIFAGVTEQVLAERLLPNSRLLRSGILRRDPDGEIVVHDNLRRFLAGGAHGDPWSFLVPDTREGVFMDISETELHEAIVGLAPLMPALQNGLHLQLALQHARNGRDVAEDALRAVARQLGRQLYWVEQNEIPLASQIMARRPGEAILGVVAETDRRRNRFNISMDDESEPQVAVDIRNAPIVWLCESLSPQLRSRVDFALQLSRKGAAGARLVTNALRAGGLQLTEPETAPLRQLANALHPTELTRAASRVAVQHGGAVELRNELTRLAKLRGIPVPEAGAVTGMDAALVSIEEGDFVAVLAALSRPGAPETPTFLFSGPPGTGKSVAARLVAEHMGRPVLVKRISELLGMFVSETERQISGAFAEARSAGAVLVLDEADSLLFPRESAVRSWEISATATMLVELEARTVPVVCTTNLFERLDIAALRRFDMKLTFGFLRPEQACMAFERFFGCAAPGAIATLRNLTPGDLRTVKARADLLGHKDPTVLLDLLRRECALKPGSQESRRIGFIP